MSIILLSKCVYQYDRLRDLCKKLFFSPDTIPTDLYLRWPESKYDPFFSRSPCLPLFDNFINFICNENSRSLWFQHARIAFAWNNLKLLLNFQGAGLNCTVSDISSHLLLNDQRASYWKRPCRIVIRTFFSTSPSDP